MSSTVLGVLARPAGTPQCQGPVLQMEAPSGCSCSSQATGAASPGSHICPSYASIWPLLAFLYCCVRGVGGRLTNSGESKKKTKLPGRLPTKVSVLGSWGGGQPAAVKELVRAGIKDGILTVGPVPSSLVPASPM